MKLSHFLFAALLSCAAVVQADALSGLDPDQVLAMTKKDMPLIIDIRSEAEWQSTGVIAGSYNDGNFDENAWMAQFKQLRQNSNQPVILVCRSGKRSAKLGDILTQKLGIEHIYHLSTGILGWKQSGQTLVPNCSNNRCP
jgi:rhodanese-related sulfurtransferase